MASNAEILGNLPTNRSDGLIVEEARDGPHAAPAVQRAGELVEGPAVLPPGLPILDDTWDERDPQYPDLRCYLWSQLVQRLQAGEPKAMEELYSMFSHGVRYYLARQLGPEELDDRLHDAFVIVVDAIRQGELRDARRLMGFVRTVAKRMVSSSIERHVYERRGRVDEENGATVTDESETPEGALLSRQQTAILREVLLEMPKRDRYVLKRFYVDEAPAQEICAEMGLTMTQFRLLKSRAKNRFGEMGRKKLQTGTLSQILLRISRR